MSANMKNSFSGRDTSCDDEKKLQVDSNGVAQRSHARETKTARELCWEEVRPGAGEGVGETPRLGQSSLTRTAGRGSSSAQCGSIAVREYPSWVLRRVRENPCDYPPRQSTCPSACHPEKSKLARVYCGPTALQEARTFWPATDLIAQDVVLARVAEAILRPSWLCPGRIAHRRGSI